MGFVLRDWRVPLNTVAGSTICSFACPAGSTYTEAMITCPPTCGLDPTIDRKRDCLTVDLEGCRCDTGLLLENDRCIVQADCGCPYDRGDRAAYLPVGTAVLNNICTQQISCPVNSNNNVATAVFPCPLNGDCRIDAFQQVCQCPSDRILSQGSCFDNPCDPDPCNFNGNCVINDLFAGTFYCICNPNFAGVTCLTAADQCSVYGDPNFVTFDGENYEFRADDCQYYLVRETTPNVQIIIETEQSIVSELTQVNRVIIQETGIMVEFIWDAQGNIDVLVDNLRVIPPIAVTGQAGVIVNAGANSYLTFISNTRGYSVRVNSQRAVDVKYPRFTTSLRTGLCGDANGIGSLNTLDQLTVNIFGEDQRVLGCTAVVPPNIVTVPCILGQERVCALLEPSNAVSLLQPCFSTVNPAPFYENCRKDLCLSNAPSKACAVISTYAQWCRDFDVPIGNWRANTDCALTCPPNSFVNLNAPAMPPTCADPNPVVSTNPLPNVESCSCTDGFILEGTVCIPVAQCGCSFLGTYFGRGQTFFSSSCTTSCTCPLTGIFDTTSDCTASIQCHADASCTVMDNVQACVCNAGLEGDGINCFEPGCGANPCPGLVCRTRVRPAEPDNPDYFCECPIGFIGQDCSIFTTVPRVFSSTNAPGNLVTRSPNFGFQYPPNANSFTQFYCSSATYMTVTFNSFVTETDRDFLFMGVGFPTVALEGLRALAGDVAQPFPRGILALNGVKDYGVLTFNTDALFFFFTTDADYELTGYDIEVSCLTTPIPDGTISNCFDGRTTQPNGAVFEVTPCETCICQNQQIACVVTDLTTLDADVNSYNNILNSQNMPNLPSAVRGIACSNDGDCSALAGSECVMPTCLSASCPAFNNRVCTSGDALRFCRADPLCLQIDLFLAPELSTSLVLNSVCNEYLRVLATPTCFLVECFLRRDSLGKRKRSTDVTGITINIGARSQVRSRAELEEQIRELLAILPNRTALLKEEFDYVSDVKIYTDDGRVVPTEASVNINEAETGILDTETTPWTYLLATFAAILLLIAVGLTVTIVSYYRKQSHSLNVKFEPAAPSYPNDNLPESLEMVKSGERKDTVFARRIPLDDSTGNKDNVFALSWSREDNDKKKLTNRQSNC